jgi:hypothetical protein
VLYDLFYDGRVWKPRKDGEASPHPCTKAHSGLQFLLWRGGPKVIALLVAEESYVPADLTLRSLAAAWTGSRLSLNWSCPAISWNMYSTPIYQIARASWVVVLLEAKDETEDVNLVPLLPLYYPIIAQEEIVLA